MGQGQSKPSSSQVFLPESPTKISSKLSSTLGSNVETDYTLNQYSAKYIEDKVSERLYKARVDADAELKAAADKIAEISASRLPQHDSPELQERLSKLRQSLDGRPKKGKLSKEAEKAREELVECIDGNKDRILNCRAAFAAFQDQVRKVESQVSA